MMILMLLKLESNNTMILNHLCSNDRLTATLFDELLKSLKLKLLKCFQMPY